MRWLYRIGLIVSSLALIYLLYTFLVDFGGRESSLLIIMLILGGLIGLAVYLESSGKLTAAAILLLLPMIPLVLYGLFVLMFVVLSPDFK